MFLWRIAGRALIALTALTAFAGSASAQVPPDQRRQMRQEMRDYWRQAPPEERQRYRENRRDGWQSMPQDDRQRMRDEMRGRRDAYGSTGQYGGGDGRGQRGGRY